MPGWSSRASGCRRSRPTRPFAPVCRAFPVHGARRRRSGRRGSPCGRDGARGAHILDAGCGPGRLGGYLAAAGHDAVGVDVDPTLIEAAEQDHPGHAGLSATSAELDCPRGITDPFDVIVSAGNVMTSPPAPGSRCWVGCAPTCGPTVERCSVRRRPRLPVRRVLPGRGRGRFRGRPAAVHVGFATVHRRRRLRRDPSAGIGSGRWLDRVDAAFVTSRQPRRRDRRFDGAGKSTAPKDAKS